MVSREAIAEFLDKFALSQPTPHCPTCGTRMASVPLTFYFDGSQWHIELPYCKVCTAQI
jgi:hypothetical protein